AGRPLDVLKYVRGECADCLLEELLRFGVAAGRCHIECLAQARASIAEAPQGPAVVKKIAQCYARTRERAEKECLSAFLAGGRSFEEADEKVALTDRVRVQASGNLDGGRVQRIAEAEFAAQVGELSAEAR